MEGKQTESRKRELRRHESKPTFEEKVEVLQQARLSKEERIQYEIDIKNEFLCESAEESENEDEERHQFTAYQLLLPEDQRLPKTIPQMADAVDTAVHLVSDTFLEDLEQPTLTKQELLSLTSGSALEATGTRVSVPAIATEGNEKADKIRKERVKNKAKTKLVGGDLEHPDDDVPEEQKEQHYMQNRVKVALDRLEITLANQSYALRKKQRQELVEVRIHEETQGMSRQEYLAYRKENYNKIDNEIKADQRQKGKLNSLLYFSPYCKIMYRTRSCKPPPLV